jgi:hypothetical protein
VPTLPRQDRLRASGADADELLPAGASLVTQETLLGDLNAIRSQLRRVVRKISDGTHWYDDPAPGGIGGGGGSGGSETLQNKRMPARTTSADGQRACDIALATSPVTGSYVGVRVNGIDVPDIGDGSKVAACYFSGDAGATARAWVDIDIGDVLYWNGSIAGYQLDSTVDLIDFIYEGG